MGYDSKDNLLYFGADVTNQEMDVEFKKLYDNLLAYKNNIFRLIDSICSECEAGELLAMDIAERDSFLLQSLVAKECESRRMVRKAGIESILEHGRNDGAKGVPIKQVLKVRESSLRDAPQDD